MGVVSVREILVAENIWKTFPGVVAVKGASLKVYEGEIVGLVGENGAGKSTLLKVLTGVLRRDRGRVNWLGRDVDFHSPFEALKNGIMYVPQDIVLAKNLSLADNIFLGMENQRFFSRKRSSSELETARKVLKELGVDLDPNLKGGDVGTAVAQLVLIARALHFNAKLLAFDEPTSALGPVEVRKLLDLMLKLKNKGISMIFVSHKIEEVMEVADRIYVMRDGEIVAEFTRDNYDLNAVIKAMIAREVREFFPKEQVQIGEVVFEVKELADTSGVVKNISFYVKRGEIVGIYGIVGSGRTEMAQTLVGFRRRKSGRVVIEGKEVVIRNPADALMNGVAYLPEDWRLSLVFLLPVKNNISLPILNTPEVKAFNAGLMSAVKSTVERYLAEKYIKMLRIVPPDPNRKAQFLSGGNRQKVAIAKLLAAKAKVLILDEPTHGIDVGTKVEIRRLMVELAKEGKAIVLISSELPEVLNMSDRVYVMRDGEIVAEFTREEVSEEKVIKAAVLKKL